ncbi:MAG: LysR substrate-binding domain-containing protein [Verrucomicrobiales bacterium]
MELRHLRYFVMAAEEENISRAAARLNLTQPAVSRQIRDLESDLGLPLFDRESGGLKLTEAGQAALPHAQDILRRAEGLSSAMAAFKRQPKRSLRVGFIPTALPGFLAAALRTFNQRHDDVCTQIREMSPVDQERALRDGEIDVALIGSPCPEILAKFKSAELLKTPLAIVLPDDHLLALRKSIDLAELEGERFVSLDERHFPGRPALIADLGERAGFTLDVGMKAEGLPELLGLVAGGAGVGVLPQDVHQLPHPGVVFIRMRRPSVQLVSSAVWRSDAESDELLELIGLLKESSRRG